MTTRRRSASLSSLSSDTSKIGSRALAIHSLEERRDLFLHTYIPTLKPSVVPPTTSDRTAKKTPSLLASLEKTLIRLIAPGGRRVRAAPSEFRLGKVHAEDQGPMEITPFRTLASKRNRKDSELLPLPPFLSPVEKEKEKPLRVLLLKALTARSGMGMPVYPAVVVDHSDSDSDSDSDDDEEIDRERRRNEFEGWNSCD